MSSNKNLFMGIVALSLSPIVLANHHIPASTDTWVPSAYVGLQGGDGMTHSDDVEKLGSYLLGYDNISNIDGFAGRVYFGYDFHKNIAIEAGYSYLFNKPSAIMEESDEHFNLCGNTWAIDLMGVVKINIVEAFGLFTKLGINYLQTNHGDQDFDEVHNFNVAYGAGFFYDITKNISVDVSWLRYNGNEKFSVDYQPHVDNFTVGVRYKFI
jgi:opacity protein-like surface antigen